MEKSSAPARVLSVVETCKKRGLSPFTVIHNIVSAVLAKQPILTFFSLPRRSQSHPGERLQEARVWVDKFIGWYNGEHRHSGIGYVTPQQRHTGEDKVLLAQRDKVYQAARAANPNRWSRQTRNWQWRDSVTLNPEREKQAV